MVLKNVLKFHKRPGHTTKLTSSINYLHDMPCDYVYLNNDKKLLTLIKSASKNRMEIIARLTTNQIAVMNIIYARYSLLFTL